MNLHRLLCAFGRHWFVRLAQRHRGCAVCFQQQRYITDVYGQHGFWLDMRPDGRIEAPPAADAVREA